MELYKADQTRRKAIAAYACEALTLRAQFYYEAIRNWEIYQHILNPLKYWLKDPFPQG
jgi:hypothetical protein